MKNFFTILILVFTFLSCSNDNNNTNNSRVFKYEVSGNYTESTTIVYYTANGSTSTEEDDALPWTKEVTYESNVKGIAIVASPVVAKPGIPGQTLTLKIYRGNKLIKESTATVLSNGYFNLNSGSITL